MMFGSFKNGYHKTILIMIQTTFQTMKDGISLEENNYIQVTIRKI